MRPLYFIVAETSFDDQIKPVAVKEHMNDALNFIRDQYFSPYAINCRYKIFSVYEPPLCCHIVDNKLFFE